MIMTKIYTTLPTLTLQENVPFIHPHEPPVVAHLDDLALHVMEDLKYTRAVTIHPKASIDDAYAEMKICNVKVLLVANEATVIGLISAEDILGEKPIKIMQERRLQRGEITTEMVMTPQSDIAVFDMAELKHAKVGNIVETLKAIKQHYALVVQINEGAQTVRGLFSSSRLSEQLAMDVTYDLSSAQSISELQKDLSE